VGVTWTAADAGDRFPWPSTATSVYVYVRSLVSPGSRYVVPVTVATSTPSRSTR
jgi:hypothetical protein